VISIGSLTSSIVHPREVFKPALEYSAVAIIIAHNHPSGALKITEADLEVTQKLAEAGQILGIDLLDHLIIAKNKFVSIPFKI
jgi:DNA repair protein RadC